MKIRRSPRIAPAVLLALIAGSTAPLRDSCAQTDANRRDTVQQRDDRRAPAAGGAARTQARAYDFVRGSSLIGADVENPNGETVGEITDLIFDRGSGRVEYALVESGDVLGIGGKTIAVAYPRFGYDAADKHLTLNMTPEQVKRAASFVPENWKDLRHTTWADDLDDLFDDDDDDHDHDEVDDATRRDMDRRDADQRDADRRDMKRREADRRDAADADRHDDDRDDEEANAIAIAAATEEAVKGRIVSVRRQSVGDEEQVIATVQTDDGQTREVVMGPSWFIMSHNAAPMRGDEIEARVRSIAATGGARRAYLSSGTIGGDRLIARDESGRPAWRIDTDTDRADRREPRAGEGRLMLLSDLIGATARALDKDGGEIQDVVIERTSGHIAVLGFDPDENILGMADTIRAVPWTIANVGRDGKVRFDADKDMLTAAEPMPKDLTTYGAGAAMDNVYRAFRVDVPRFEPVSARDIDDLHHPDALQEYAWVKDASSAPAMRLEGKIVDVRSEAVAKGEPHVHVLTVENEGGRQEVVVCPSWYMEKQRVGLNDGDRVVIDGRAVEIDGRRYTVARTITRGTDTMKFWNDNTPVWSGANPSHR